MEKVKQTCLLSILTLLGTAAAIFTFVYFNPPVPPDNFEIKGGELPLNIILGSNVVVALAGALLLFLGIGYPFTALKRLVAIFRIVSASLGRIPKDGKTIAVIGPIRATKKELTAPGSNESCVAYEYTVYKHRKLDKLETGKLGGQGTKNYFTGYALTPSFIESSFGPVKLLAVPDIDLPLMGKTYGDMETLKDVKNYVNRNTFVECSIRHPSKEAFFEMRNELIMGPIIQDYRYVKKDSDLSGCEIVERQLKPDEIVCAIGMYSSAQRALIHNPKANEVHSIQVQRGPVSKIILSLLGSAVGYLAGSIVCLGIFTAIFKAFYNLYYLYDLFKS